MLRFRAVLFDFDGTLADSYAAITASVNHVLQQHGQPTLTEEKVRTLVGHGLENLMASILPGIDPGAAARIYREHHPTVMESLTRLLPGVADGLIALRDAGIHLGVCSNKPSYFTRALLQILKIDPYFDVVLGPDDAGAAKPDPAMVLQAITRLGVSKEETLYVGDMAVDIETGQRAGVQTWVMPTGSHDESTLRASRPARVFAEMSELISEVLRLEPNPARDPSH